MPGWLSKPAMMLVPLDNGRDWQNVTEIIFARKNGDCIYVPAGIITDGASIPRFLWRVVGPPMSGLYRRAAVVHDDLFRRAGPKPDFDECNEIFEEIMEYDKVEWWRRSVIMSGVRNFGGGSFKS